MKKTVLFLFILFGLLQANAQYSNRRYYRSTFAFDVQTGGTMFYGDVSRNGFLPQNRGDVKDYGIAFSLGAKLEHKKGIDIRAAFISGTLNGIRYVPQQYQVYFKNVYQEIDFTLAYDPFKKGRKLKRLKTSGVVGLGAIHYRSQLRALRTHKLMSTVGYLPVDLRYLQLKEERPETDFVWIAGFSIAYNVHPNIDVLFEHTYRLASSSKLDAMPSGPFNDFYAYTSAGISFRIK